MRGRRTAIEQWARLLWLSKYSKEKLIAIFSYAAYFDASGKKEHPVLSVGGAVAPVHKWMRFEQDWSDVLKQEGVTEFHATDFASGGGEYRGWKDDKKRRSRFSKALREILRRNTNKLFCACIELEAWRSVNEEYLLAECLHSPYALCGLYVANEIKKWHRRNKKRTMPKVIFEDGDEGWEGLKKLCNGIGMEPIRLPKKEAIPCQAGDLIAWKGRIAFTNGIKKLSAFMADPNIQDFYRLLDEDKSLKSILVRPGTPGVFSRPRLIETCKNLRIPKRPLKIEMT
jgi:hypothetical protein